MTRKTFEEFPIAPVFLGRHGRDGNPAALAQRGPRCPGHPCLGSGSKDVDARVKPAHDGGNAASRRDVLRASVAIFASGILPGTGGFTQHARAQAVTVEPAAITPALVQAAGKEGKLAFYTAMDLPVAEKFGKAFEARYPGISVRVERSGAERVFQRIGQEMESRIHAVDVAQSSDAAHYIAWKREGILIPCVPEDVAKYFPAQHKDVDGLFASWRVWLCGIGYNTKLVRVEEAPKSFADLLDPKWTGKLVKAHPSYSGTIMTATFQIVRELGWGYLEKLAKQKVLQVQSSTDPPKKLALGERAVMADGNDYNLIQLKEAGQAVEVVYPAEGTPLVAGPSAIFKSAPNPNAARLFQNWLHSLEAQQLLVDFARQHSVHPQVREKPGARKLNDIKTWKDNPAGVEKASEEIKTRYAQLFKV